jgi:hypothetical protein
MAITITTSMCDTFKKELLMGSHLFKASAGNTFKMGLVKATAAGSGTYNTANTNWGSGAGSPTTSNVGTDETSDTANARYTTGGFTMTPNADPTIGTNIAWVDWTTDPNWGPDASISSYGAFLYNSTLGGNMVGVFAFGADKTSTTGTFTVVLPTPAFTTALIRI